MVTKFLIVTLCMVAGTMTGAVFSKKLSKRAEYFESLLRLVNVIISEVKFRKSSTKKILSDFCETDNSYLKENLKEYINCEDFSTLKLSKNILNNEEIHNVKSLLLSLGTTDGNTQIFELENYKLKISDTYKTAEEKKKKLGGLYIKLGFFAGHTLGIII